MGANCCSALLSDESTTIHPFPRTLREYDKHFSKSFNLRHCKKTDADLCAFLTEQADDKPAFPFVLKHFVQESSVKTDNMEVYSQSFSVAASVVPSVIEQSSLSIAISVGEVVDKFYRIAPRSNFYATECRFRFSFQCLYIGETTVRARLLLISALPVESLRTMSSRDVISLIKGNRLGYYTFFDPEYLYLMKHMGTVYCDGTRLSPAENGFGDFGFLVVSPRRPKHVLQFSNGNINTAVVDVNITRDLRFEKMFSALHKSNESLHIFEHYEQALTFLKLPQKLAKTHLLFVNLELDDETASKLKMSGVEFVELVSAMGKRPTILTYCESAAMVHPLGDVNVAAPRDSFMVQYLVMYGNILHWNEKLINWGSASNAPKKS